MEQSFLGKHLCSSGSAPHPLTPFFASNVRIQLLYLSSLLPPVVHMFHIVDSVCSCPLVWPLIPTLLNAAMNGPRSNVTSSRHSQRAYRKSVLFVGSSFFPFIMIFTVLPCLRWVPFGLFTEGGKGWVRRAAETVQASQWPEEGRREC